MSRNKRCIFVANTQASALGTSHWLASQGVENLIMDTTTLGIPYGISFSSQDPASDGWQIWIKDESQLELAEKLLGERNQQKEKRKDLGPIEATCDRCQQTSQFEGQDRGSVQNCPYCNRFMDVGGAEDEFEWPKF